MADDEIMRKLQDLEAKIDAVYASSEKMRRYFLWTLIITVALVVIPLMLMPLFVTPFLQSQGMGLGL